jgi:hypothetical protein
MQAGLATYATGIAYGLQPDALFVVVPALALPSKAAALAYCAMFVVGTVTAMGSYTLLIGALLPAESHACAAAYVLGGRAGTTSAALTKERPWLQAHLSTMASAVAIVVGLLIGLGSLGVEVPFF